MDIYIQSRGFEQDYDYRWLQLCEDGSTRLQLPPIGLEVINLIDSETPSVVLERLADERLLLLLTGIEPEGRVDFLDRPIRIALAWVGSSADELVLRCLAAWALREAERIHSDTSSPDSLAAQINQAVPLGGEYGFEVSPHSMFRVVSAAGTQGVAASEPPNLTKKIGLNSPVLRHELAAELQTCNLPPETGPLVVVTGIKKRESLEKVGVWRSLSALVDGEDWQEIHSPSAGWWSNHLETSADLKNPMIWLTVLGAIVAYWLTSIFNLLSSPEKGTSQTRRELKVNPKETGNDSRRKS